MHTGEAIDPQDMRFMGGLRKKMPVTFWTFVAGGWHSLAFPSSPQAFGLKMRSSLGHSMAGICPYHHPGPGRFADRIHYTARQITLVFLGERA